MNQNEIVAVDRNHMEKVLKSSYYTFEEKSLGFPMEQAVGRLSDDAIEAILKRLGFKK
jgi:hypothetical protein